MNLSVNRWVVVTLLVLINIQLSLSGSTDEGGSTVKEVIVVGGGMAGLAAARMIQNHPSKNYHVIVLEGRKSRYGGRIWVDRETVKNAKGTEADLGAMFIKSSLENNPILKLAKDFGLNIKTLGPLQLHLLGQEKVLAGEEVQEIFKEVFQVLKSAVLQTKESGKDRPLTEAIEAALTSYQGSVDKELLSAVIRVNPSTFFGDQSALYCDPGKDFGWDTVVLDGLDQLADRIVAGVPVDEELPLDVELHKIVRQIQVHKKRKKVLVRLTDRTQYVADAVIVALPLGVLQQGMVLFDPPLSTDWRTSVTEIGIGIVNKVILEFDQSFWPENIGVFMTVPKDTNEPDFISIWLNVYSLLGKPCLIGTVYGETAVKFENMTDEMVKQKALESLEKLFGREAVQSRNITSILRSRWSSDKFSSGSVSYLKVGNTPDKLKVFSEPVCPYIYFAGEYTASPEMNSVHGAYTSGVRAAEQLLTGLCKNVKAHTAEMKERMKEKPQKKDMKPDGESLKDKVKVKRKEREKTSKSKNRKDEL